jgi:hypothetical protein
MIDLDNCDIKLKSHNKEKEWSFPMLVLIELKMRDILKMPLNIEFEATHLTREYAQKKPSNIRSDEASYECQKRLEKNPNRQGVGTSVFFFFFFFDFQKKIYSMWGRGKGVTLQNHIVATFLARSTATCAAKS